MCRLLWCVEALWLASLLDLTIGSCHIPYQVACCLTVCMLFLQKLCSKAGGVLMKPSYQMSFSSMKMLVIVLHWLPHASEQIARKS